MKAMKIRLVFEDWRQLGTPKSIYQTELGFELSIGHLHAGTTFEGIVVVEDEVADELARAWKAHVAYPVFSHVPEEQP